MTDEQINAAIETVLHRNEHWIISRDYCTDLNAMHDAEERLGVSKRSFAMWLAQILYTTPRVDLDDQFLNIHATARQRAEAFLRTLGKWQEAVVKGSLTAQPTTEESSAVQKEALE
jgi:hypothetical protein